MALATHQDQSQVLVRTRADDEAEIRVVLDAIAEAVRARDVDAMLAHCAPEIATFDLMPPLKHEGPDAIRRIWANTAAELEGPLEYDQHYLELMVGDEVAFCRSLNRFGGDKHDGSKASTWICSTMGFCKIGGRWKLVHQHSSVPFDMDSGQALLALQP